MRNQTNHGDQNNQADDRQQNQFAEIHVATLGESSQFVKYSPPKRLPHEAGLKLLSVPCAPKKLPVTALIRNFHGIAEWKLFLNDKV